MSRRLLLTTTLFFLILVSCSKQQETQVVPLILNETIRYAEDSPPAIELFKNNRWIKLSSEEDYPSKPVINGEQSKLAFISPFEFELLGEAWIYDTSTNEKTKIFGSEQLEESISVRAIEWVDNSSLLILTGYQYGTISSNEKLYYYNIDTNEYNMALELQPNQSIKKITMQDETTFTFLFYMYNEDFSDFIEQSLTLQLNEQHIFSDSTNSLTPAQPTESNESPDIIEQLIHVLQQNDSTALYEFVEAYGLETMLKHEMEQTKFYTSFLNHLSYDLDLSSLSFLEVSAEQYEGRLVYQLYSTNEERAINNLIVVDDDKFYWDYLSYLPYASFIIDDYIKAIKQKDDTKITRIMTPDDIQYSVEHALKLVENYNNHFSEIESLSANYLGDFTFELINDKNESHIIKIGYGDGLMFIIDPFDPSQT